MNEVYIKLQKMNFCKEMEDNLPVHILNHCKKYQGERYLASVFTYDLLGSLLKEFDLKLDNVEFLDSGKPFIKHGYISLTHSKDYVGVSYSKVNHGIDIQVNEKEFEEKKVKRLNMNKETFYEDWVKKEAYVKMIDGNILDLTLQVQGYSYLDSFKEKGLTYYLCVCTKQEVNIIKLK